MTFRDMMQDAAIDNLAQQHRAADGATTDVLGSLAAQLAAAKAELARQNIATTALVQMLIERGVVDGAELKARFDRAMSQAQAANSLVSCARCKRQVDKRSTQMTSSGGMCNACYQDLMSDE